MAKRLTSKTVALHWYAGWETVRGKMLSVLKCSMEHFRDQVCSADFADAIKLDQNSDLGAAIDLSFGCASLNALFLQTLELRMHYVQPFELAPQLTEDETTQLPAVPVRIFESASFQHPPQRPGTERIPCSTNKARMRLTWRVRSFFSWVRSRDRRLTSSSSTLGSRTGRQAVPHSGHLQSRDRRYAAATITSGPQCTTNTFNSAGDKIGKAKISSHGADSPSEIRPAESQTSSKVSHPILDADKGSTFRAG